MKKKLYILVFSVVSSFGIKAQNQYDISHLLGNDLNGTARFVGMGGAMSALGGDISVIGTNPAGIGIYRSSDVSMSFGLNNTKTKSDFNGTSMNENKTVGSFDQIGFVYSTKIGNYTSLKYVNFAFNYHKDKNFNRLFSAGGSLDNLSQSWQIAGMLSDAGVTSQDKYDAILNANNPYTYYWSNYPVLSILGARTGVADYAGGSVLGWNGFNNNFFSKETGGIYSYDFNVAFNLEDQFYLGLTLGVLDVDYNKYSSYTENLSNEANEDVGGYTLDNRYKIEGNGVNLKLGMIIRPFAESPFRFGLAVSTPTWYDLTQRYDATLSSDITALPGKYSQTLSDFLGYDYLNQDFNVATPWKFNVSLGTTLMNVLALDAEYEYEDYSSSKVSDFNGTLYDSESRLDALNGVSTFKVGMEAKITPEFSFRSGYNYTTAAFKSGSYNNLIFTSTEFNNTKERNTLTLGLGFRGSIIYGDLAYKYDIYKSDFYAFDDAYDPDGYKLSPTKVDNTRNQLIFTIGARF